MKAFGYIPFFAYLLIVYNVLAFAGGQPSALNHILFDASLISGARFSINVDNLLIMLGVLGLYFQILRSVKSSAASIIGIALSMLVFVVFLVEFITVKPVGNVSFLILTLMAMMDVIAGFTVSISAARRDITVER